jgi:uroporphyrinogen decarboxylase
MTHTETMTPRERVNKALNHQEPDRIPIDLGGFQTGIHRIPYASLVKHLGIEEAVNILDAVQQIVVPSEAVLRRFHADIRYVTAHGPHDFQSNIELNERGGRKWHDLRDEFGVVWSMPADQMLYMDISHHPLANANLKDLKSYPFPNGGDASRFTGVRERALQLRRDTPYALSSGICGVSYEICWYMRGMEQWFMDMKEDVRFCEALIDHTAQYWVDWMHAFLEEVGDVLDVVMIGDDLTGQDGPLFSPQFYRDVVRPRQQSIIDVIKKKSQCKIWYHTCGDCSVYVPDFIDMGIDILNPVQTNSAGMDPAKLKKMYGKNIVFWGGGIDSQRVLPFASPQEVRQAVKHNVEIFKPGGGYVFNNVHNIQPGVPPENIAALFDAAYEFGFYR